MQKASKFLQRLILSTKKFVAGNNSLSQQMMQGGFWVFLSYGGGRLLDLIRSIILARLLLPADFGLIGLAEVATGLLVVFTEMGVAPALIYKQDDTEEVINTAWIISILRCLLLCLITLLAAGPIANFFGSKELKPILQVMSLIFIIHGLTSIGLVLLQKNLAFQKLALLSLVGNLFSLVLAVFAALMLRNVWALVIGKFTQAIVMLIGSYMIHPFRPRLRWSSQAANFILNYGKFILGSDIVNYFLTQGDDALVGKMLGTTQLGYYGMAYRLSNMPATSISHVISQISFPAYAKLKDDIPSLRQTYIRILTIISICAIPMAGGLFILAPEIIRVLYGEKWVPMIPSFMVLCIYGLERSLNSPVAPLFKAKGKPNIILNLLLFKLGLLALIIYPLTKQLGILGTSIASSLVAVVISANAIPLVAKALNCSIKTILKPFASPAAATGLMVGALYLLKFWGYFDTNIFTLFLFIFVGVVVFFASLLVIDRSIRKRVKDFFNTNIKLDEASSIPN